MDITPIGGQLYFLYPTYFSSATGCPILLKCTATELLGFLVLTLERCSLMRVFRALLVCPTYAKLLGHLSMYITFVVEQVTVPFN